MKKQQIYKVVVLGEGTSFIHSAEVGKTSVTLKYVNDVFNEKLPRTVNASYLEK
jgi:GTPase SAR1 family protein